MSAGAETGEGSAWTGRYTAVWPCGMASERKWLLKIFRPFLAGEIFDPERKHPAVDHAIVFDIFINACDPEYYRQYRGLDAFIVDLRDENYDTLPAAYANFRGVIRNHWSDVFRPETVKFLPLGYSEDFEPQPFQPSSARKYVWSFIGQGNKSTRPDMLRALAPVEPHLMFTTDDLPGTIMWNQVGGKGRRYHSSEMAAVLRDSVFGPAPMGNVNLDCFRLYEALESGCIPIVERRMTLDYFREVFGEHPIPTVRSWPEARRLVRKLVNQTDQLDQLQARCVEWWAGYKQRYAAELGRFLDERSADTRILSESDIVLPKRHKQWWKPLELLRHHDARAAWRRIWRMGSRLVRGQKLRMAYNAPARK